MWAGCYFCFPVAKSCPTLFDSMSCSTQTSVLQYVLEFAQTHIHRVDDAIQPPNPLSPHFSCSQSFPASGSFQWVSSSHQVAKVLELSASVLRMNIQDWFPLGLTGWISLLSKGLSRGFSNTTVGRLGINIELFLWGNL